MRHFNSISPLQALLLVAIAVAMAACASMGRPAGGPRDQTPPVFVSSSPAQGSHGVDKNKIDLYFDENVQLDDPSNKIIVSPVQTNQPVVRANGKHVTIELKDTLKPNATYTVDFGDAIKDLNEGNILDGLTYVFSTGDSIDSLRIAGIVLEAETLEPAQGMLVGVHSDLSDTALYTKPFERVARTNQLGQFAIQGLKAGQYRVYAINDLNRDNKWDRSEDVAVGSAIIEPYCEPIEVVDTLRSSAGTDSLRSRAGTAYFPNDVLLTWFNEGYKAQYLKDYKRPDRRRITINMAAPADSLPVISIAQGPNPGNNSDNWTVLSKNQTLDSLVYWISDSAVLHTDSLTLSVKYQRTDTADLLSWRTDTLKFFFKDPKPSKKDKEKAEADTLPTPTIFMGLSASANGSLDVYKPLSITANEPIASIDSSGFRLETLVDTLWVPIEDIHIQTDSLRPLTHRHIKYDWTPGGKYRFVVDSASVHNIYGEPNKKLQQEFTVKNLEEYSNLTFNVLGLDSVPAVVELLDKSDKPIARATANGGSAEFKYLAPGTFYARLFIDANGNGKWDTGNVKSNIQPEDVYYYPKKLTLRKNWDIEQDWDLNDTPVDLQKPYDIKKNKPKLKNGEKAPNQYDEEDEDEFGGQYGPGNYGPGRGSNQYGSGNMRGAGAGNMRGGGGFRNNY